MKASRKNKFLITSAVAVMAIALSGWALSKQTVLRLPHFQSPSRDFSFIEYDLNDLDIYKPEENFNYLFSKMEKLIFEGEGKISIVHIGGSHVQGGFLTDRMRQNFAGLSYGLRGERGLVFPYKLAGTNSPSSIKCKWVGSWSGCRNSVSSHQCDWGVSGISAITNDSVASVELYVQNPDSSLYASNKIRLYYQSSGNYGVLLDSTITATKIDYHSDKGYIEYQLDRDYRSVKFHFKRPGGDAGYFAFQGVYFGNDEPGFIYNPIGVNGAGTYSYLRCGLFGEQMKTIKPDLVLFAIGVNDANVPEGDFNASLFEARYDSLVGIIKESNPHVSFIFITNNDTYYNRKYPNKNAIKVQEVMQSLAEKHNGAVYDLFAIMGGLGSIDDWRDNNLAAKDRIHLTKKGYELQADLMFDAFRKSFGDYLSEPKIEN